eukprot:sb/3478533/
MVKLVKGVHRIKKKFKPETKRHVKTKFTTTYQEIESLVTIEHENKSSQLVTKGLDRLRFTRTSGTCGGIYKYYQGTKVTEGLDRLRFTRITSGTWEEVVT